MTDKRKVSTDALETLGTIIDETQKRDAIHLAVIPAKAGEDIFGGQRVYMVGKCAYLGVTDHIGIADPFYYGEIKEGQWFWLVINPRVITSLRHVWTHPELPDEPGTPNNEKGLAKNILQDYAKRLEIDFEKMIAILHKAADDEGWVGDNEEFTSVSAPENLWEAFELYTGRELNEKQKQTYFHCSC